MVKCYLKVATSTFYLISSPVLVAQQFWLKIRQQKVTSFKLQYGDIPAHGHFTIGHDVTKRNKQTILC